MKPALRKSGMWGVGAAGAAALAFALWCVWPVPSAMLAPPAAQTLTLEDRHGEPLRTARGGDGALHTWLPLAAMDPRVLQAFIALEDRRFYDHHGIDPRAVARAARDNLRAGRVVSGASTLTMQLARLLAGSGRHWPGKIHQALWALRLDLHLSKQEILEQYLNRVPLGQGAIGVAAGAALYFGSEPGRLSLGQAALLAGIARTPSRDNPLVSPARAAQRRSLALDRMHAAGFATADEIRRAAGEPLRPPGPGPFRAAHFTTRLLQWLDEHPGIGRSARTSLDLALQDAVEAEVRHTVDLLRDRRVQHGAAVVIDTRTGEILAWVGSPDFWADTMGQVDMVVSPRQPGSTLKPFVYGLAFDRGHTAASVLPDVARVYQTATGPYRPRNYDRVYHGPVRARDALASSFNVPAVELVERVGPASLLHTLHRAGFTSLGQGAEHYGLGLALGNGDVTLLELANGYRAIANGGVAQPVEIWATDRARSASADGPRVMSEGAAALVLDILADPLARLPGFGPGSALELPFPAATKTGTSRHFTDNWAVVTTAGFIVATWVGNFSGRPMRGVSGVSGAAPLAARVALAAARRYPPGSLPTPAAVGAARHTICRLSGRAAGPACPAASEWFLPGTAPAGACDWHRDGGLALPPEYAAWLAGTDGTAGPGAERAAAATLQRAHSAGATTRPGALRIVSPEDGDRFSVPPGTDPRYATIALRAAGTRPSEPVRWFVNGRPVGSARWAITPGRHTVRVESSTGAWDEVRIEVR